MKRLFIMLVLLATVTLVAVAQKPIKRPTKTNTAPAKPAKKPVKKPAKPTKNTNSTSSSAATLSDEGIIDNLVRNMVYVEGGTFTMGATSEQINSSSSGSTPRPARTSACPPRLNGNMQPVGAARARAASIQEATTSEAWLGTIPIGPTPLGPNRPMNSDSTT